MTVASEQEKKRKVEAPRQRPVVRAAYFRTLEKAKASADKSLVPDAAVRRVRVPDYSGRTVEALGKEAG